MTEINLDLNPVLQITVDAIGKPGERVFYLQATHETGVLTLLVEKIQVQSLAMGIEQFMAELFQKFPKLPEVTGDYDETQMHITPPVDPLFRVGELGLGYESDQDRIVVMAREIAVEGQDLEKEPLGVVRFWCSRQQVRALGHWGIELVNRGRPICPQCGEPMDPSGHFCPKKNGHKH